MLTTSIMMYTQMGDFEAAIGLASVLVGLMLVLAGILTAVQQGGAVVNGGVVLAARNLVLERRSRQGAFRLSVSALDLRAGESLVVLGPNGAGKSTLLRALAGLSEPVAGRIESHVEGPVTLVFQSPAALAGSVLHNVRAALLGRPLSRAEVRQRALAALERFEVAHLAARRAATLSGGELRRLALARAFVLEPAASALCELARSLSAPLTGPLRMGVIPTVGPYLLPRVLPAVREAFPDLSLFLREDLTPRLLEQLASAELDVLLLALDVELGDVERMPLFSDPFLFAAPRDDERAGAETVELEELDGRQVLLLEEGHCLRDQTLPLCESGGAELGGFRASSLGTIAQMVANGLGVTLLPELAVEREAAAAPGLVVIPFASDGPSRSVGLAWRPSSPRAEEFHALGDVIARAYAAC